MLKYVHADGYSEAIPLDDLEKIAEAVGRECTTRSEGEVRACAERIVRAKLCPCASSVKPLVDAVVAEFRRHVQ